MCFFLEICPFYILVIHQIHHEAIVIQTIELIN